MLPRKPSAPNPNQEFDLQNPFGARDAPESRDLWSEVVTEAPGLPQPGDMIGSSYRVKGELGRGAMGIVFSAVDEQLQRKVAIKLIHTQLLTPSLRQRFMQEARAMARVNHPNVLAIHSLGEHASAPYFVMELVEGQTLDQFHAASGNAIELDLALRILSDICEGVSAIHAAGAIHRDLKPSNVLLDASLRARVCDLGLATRLLEGGNSREIAGTPAYMAPELAFREQAALPSPESDVYSLGCIAFELLTGAPPFCAETTLGVLVQHATAPVPLVSTLRPNLPPAFDYVLARALSKEPKTRTPTVELFRRSLLEAREQGLEPVRILVAEDDDDFRELLALKLKMEFPDTDIECVANGRAALDAFDARPASVVMIDLQMPILDGTEVTAALRSRSTAANVPIIVLTASGGPAEWRRLSQLGADRFLVKPVNLDDVVTTIRRAVRERSSSLPPPPASRIP
jgi:eukaryotic-like serine/threonine-protein kinase